MPENKHLLIVAVLVLLLFWYWYTEKSGSKKYDYGQEPREQTQEKYPAGQEFGQLSPYYSEEGDAKIPYSVFLKSLNQKTVEKVIIKQKDLPQEETEVYVLIKE